MNEQLMEEVVRDHERVIPVIRSAEKIAGKIMSELHEEMGFNPFDYKDFLQMAIARVNTLESFGEIDYDIKTHIKGTLITLLSEAAITMKGSLK